MEIFKVTQTGPQVQESLDYSESAPIEPGTGKNSIVQKGGSNTASGKNAAALGEKTEASGNEACSYGDSTVASGNNSHAEGHFTEASGSSSHAEGKSTTASEDYAHAEGENTTASGLRSHAEGNGTTASGVDSHAEGSQTIASGDSSHAGGTFSTASGENAFAHGESVTAQNDVEAAFGRFNVSRTGETDGDKTIFSVGVGELGAPKNAMEIRADGTMMLSNGDEQQNVQNLLGKAGTAYQKPPSGIPSTDMDNSVQEILQKADEGSVVYLNADLTLNSLTGKWEFDANPYATCLENWNNKHAATVLNLRYVGSPVPSTCSLGRVLMLIFNPRGVVNEDVFSGSICTDGETMVIVRLTSSDSYAVVKTI